MKTIIQNYKNKKNKMWKSKRNSLLAAIVTGGIFFSFHLAAQDTQRYLIFKVNNNVMDCPHFGYIIPEESSKKLGIKLIEKNTENKRMVFEIPSTYSMPLDSLNKRFLRLLDSLQFPNAMIDKVYWSKSKE